MKIPSRYNINIPARLYTHSMLCIIMHWRVRNSNYCLLQRRQWYNRCLPLDRALEKNRRYHHEECIEKKYVTHLSPTRLFVQLSACEWTTRSTHWGGFFQPTKRRIGWSSTAHCVFNWFPTRVKTDTQIRYDDRYWKNKIKMTVEFSKSWLNRIIINILI